MKIRVCFCCGQHAPRLFERGDEWEMVNTCEDCVADDDRFPEVGDDDSDLIDTDCWDEE